MNPVTHQYQCMRPVFNPNMPSWNYVRSSVRPDIVFNLDDGVFYKAVEYVEGGYCWSPLYIPTIEQLQEMRNWKDFKGHSGTLIGLIIKRT